MSLSSFELLRIESEANDKEFDNSINPIKDSFGSFSIRLFIPLSIISLFVELDLTVLEKLSIGSKLI